MVFTPSPMLLKLLYTRGSLHNLPHTGVAFSIKNRLDTVNVTGFKQVQIGDVVIPAEKIHIDLGNGERRAATDISPDGRAIELPVGRALDIFLDTPRLAEGMHPVQIWFSTDAFGDLHVEVEDAIVGLASFKPHIPRSSEDDYSEASIAARQRFAEEFSGKEFTHLKHYSFDPHMLKGNCEHFTGVAQIPVGLAGPLQVNGEHAQGEFLIPMATTEGTLVASYNRGMQVLNLCGGVKCTVIGDAMQRAPVFVFSDARGARDFGKWVEDTIDQIRPQAESTSSVAKLQYIDTYLSNKFAYLRFNFSTGDAAGQNMVGRATFAACSWILENYRGPKVEHFYLESNFATDKKASQINVMRTRGKRVVAEAVVKREVLQQRMRVTPEQAGLPRAGEQRGRLPVGGQQQRRALGQRHHGHVHRHRPGRGQRERVIGRHLVLRGHGRGRFVHQHHHSVADCGHPRRRHRPGHPKRVPANAGLRGPRYRAQVCRNRGRRGAGRRAQPGRRHQQFRLGEQPRAVRPQPLTDFSSIFIRPNAPLPNQLAGRL
ncbi:hydroxymethylglutaryl-CoA reductase [Hymenobacter humi]